VGGGYPLPGPPGYPLPGPSGYAFPGPPGTNNCPPDFYSGPSLFPGSEGRWQADDLADAITAAGQAAVFRQSTSAAKRLAAGDRSFEKGDIRLAASIFARLAGTKPPNEITATAKERLAKLADEGRGKLAEIDKTLDGLFCPAETSENTPYCGEPDAATVLHAFEDYRRVESLYGSVPEIKKEMHSHIARQRAKPEYAAVLHEGKAKEWWELGQTHEKNGQLCCAYWDYAEAKKLVPAPSALKAKQRFEALKANPEVVKSAAVCKELRWCHEAFHRAGLMLGVNPERAKEMFAEIARRAPEGAEVHRAAKAEMAKRDATE